MQPIDEIKRGKESDLLRGEAKREKYKNGKSSVLIYQTLNRRALSCGHLEAPEQCVPILHARLIQRECGPNKSLATIAGLRVTCEQSARQNRAK